MKRPAAALAALAVALTSLVLGGATPAVAATTAGSPDVAAAAQALIGGARVYIAPGGPKIHEAALKSLIGKNTIYVVSVSAPAHATDWIALLSTATRINGTYVVLNGSTLTASSNSFPAAGVEAVRTAAMKAHPTDPVAAVDEMVKSLLAGEADVSSVDPTAGTGGTTTAAATPAPAGSGGASPLLLLLLLPILAGVAYAVTRARRRTG